MIDLGNDIFKNHKMGKVTPVTCVAVEKSDKKSRHFYCPRFQVQVDMILSVNHNK